MSVTREEVDRIAGLARLELGDEEAESLRGDLNGILEHMETLAEAPAGASADGGPVPGGTEPTGEGLEAAGEDLDEAPGAEAHRQGPAPFREDGEWTPDALSLPPKELAPGWQDGFFSVPRLPGLEDETSP